MYTNTVVGNSILGKKVNGLYLSKKIEADPCLCSLLRGDIKIVDVFVGLENGDLVKQRNNKMKRENVLTLAFNLKHGFINIDIGSKTHQVYKCMYIRDGRANKLSLNNLTCFTARNCKRMLDVLDTMNKAAVGHSFRSEIF